MTVRISLEPLTKSPERLHHQPLLGAVALGFDDRHHLALLVADGAGIDDQIKPASVRHQAPVFGMTNAAVGLKVAGLFIKTGDFTQGAVSSTFFGESDIAYVLP